jgi:hypothetical protein
MGIPVSVAKDFNQADKAKKTAALLSKMKR